MIKFLPTTLVNLFWAALFLFSSLIPQEWGIRAITEAILPLLIIPVLALLVRSVLKISLLGIISGALALIVWGVQIGSAALPQSSNKSVALTVITQNLSSDNKSVAEDAQALLDKGPDILALQEFTDEMIPTLVEKLSPQLPFYKIFGTVGVWSKRPLENAVPLKLGATLTRAGQADVILSEKSFVRVYVVHMDSLRPGMYHERNEMLADLKLYLQKDSSKRLLVAGDFNAGSQDTNFKTLLEGNMQELHTSQLGFDFTWPSLFPLVSLDHVLARGYGTSAGELISLKGSDHKGILLRVHRA